MKLNKNNKKATAISIAVASVLVAPAAAQGIPEPELTEPDLDALVAQVNQQQQEAAEQTEEVLDEVTVTGRFISSSQQLVNERLTDAFATDLIGSDAITRLGDTTVGAALRRVPGLTLVQDRFVYIRGLGERYSQSTLNGAQIPSPDLTRNVIPLDVFPTAVVESLRVQKAWGPALSANFGGGAVDIRTKGIPDALTVKFEVGVGHNTANPSNVLSYNGGSDDELGKDDGTRALSPVISDGIDTYQGNPSVNQILTFMQRQDPTTVLYDAQSENRQMALALNRDISLKTESANPDYKLRGTVGNRFEIGSDWDFGFSLGASYWTDWRQRRTILQDFGQPDEQNGVREESTQSVNIAGTGNLGLSWINDHEISMTALYLRNTDDETEVYDFFNENRVKSSGRGFRNYRLQFEEREMETLQFAGEHYLGADTRERLPFLDRAFGWLPDQARFNWFYSESTAMTSIPNQVRVASETFTDRETGEVESESVRLGTSVADYRFTDLEDDVEHYGWSGMLPMSWGNSYVEFSGGWNHYQKVRTYAQLQMTLGYLDVSDPSVLQGTLGEVFSDERILADREDPLNPIPGSRVYDNNILFDRAGANSNSYIAAMMTDSVWGQVDWTIDETWRIAAGARYEDYRHASVPWNPYGYSEGTPQMTSDIDVLSESVYTEDKVYPSVAFTYMGDWWAETFQLRLGYSQTQVRPDLREITGSSYIDPITGELVFGNPGVVPADFDNFDLRAEWYFGNGDNLAVTLFHKDIQNPIEFFEIPASDTTIAREIINAESGEINGIEFEFLKELGFLGGFWDTLFLQGNVTLQETELVAGPEASAPTNEVRPLSGASDYVANFMIGFDSPNAKHTASLIYNVFGERMYVAGRLGSPDGYELPFHSLDFTYFWYPTDRMTLKFKAQNLLGETVQIERLNTIVFEEDPGTTYSLMFSWAL